ncbi:N-alpha-acetyltransferase 40 [Bienertia sinuspersici]
MEKEELNINERKKRTTKRKEILEKKRVIDGLIKAASSLKDPLASFPGFMHYNHQGGFYAMDVVGFNNLIMHRVFFPSLCLSSRAQSLEQRETREVDRSSRRKKKAEESSRKEEEEEEDQRRGEESRGEENKRKEEKKSREEDLPVLSRRRQVGWVCVVHGWWWWPLWSMINEKVPVQSNLAGNRFDVAFDDYSAYDELYFWFTLTYSHVNMATQGLCLRLEGGLGTRLPRSLKQYVQKLVKLNMEQHYGIEWPTTEKVKCREMVAPEARYIFVYEVQALASNNEKRLMPTDEHKGNVVGFVHYRFILEEELPVLYVYELQLESNIQGKGLGKFLMQLLELIAHKVV